MTEPLATLLGLLIAWSIAAALIMLVLLPPARRRDRADV
jgi:hypothetical protein